VVQNAEIALEAILVQKEIGTGEAPLSDDEPRAESDSDRQQIGGPSLEVPKIENQGEEVSSQKEELKVKSPIADPIGVIPDDVVDQLREASEDAESKLDSLVDEGEGVISDEEQWDIITSSEIGGLKDVTASGASEDVKIDESEKLDEEFELIGDEEFELIGDEEVELIGDEEFELIGVESNNEPVGPNTHVDEVEVKPHVGDQLTELIREASEEIKRDSLVDEGEGVIPDDEQWGGLGIPDDQVNTRVTPQEEVKMEVKDVRAGTIEDQITEVSQDWKIDESEKPDEGVAAHDEEFELIGVESDNEVVDSITHVDEVEVGFFYCVFQTLMRSTRSPRSSNGLREPKGRRGTEDIHSYVGAN